MQVMRIIDCIRPDKQTVMFSATFPRQMEALARKILMKPVEVGDSIIFIERARAGNAGVLYFLARALNNPSLYGCHLGRRSARGLGRVKGDPRERRERSWRNNAN